MNWLFKIFKLRALQRLRRDHTRHIGRLAEYGVKHLNDPQVVDGVYNQMKALESEVRKIENQIKLM